MPYFANVSQAGPVKYRDTPGSIGETAHET
jgi:hypothetical protein